jgi:hypothetical protein
MIIVGLALLAAVGCSKDDDNNNPGPGNTTGQVHVRLTDAPADYDSVVLDIREIAVHATGSDSASWRTFSPTDSVINVLNFINGLYADLGTFTVPAGNYDQLRLLLGPNSYVVVDGETHALTIPSGMQSGVKILGAFTVPANGTAELGLDFEAARSIHETGAGDWIMNPVIRLVNVTSAGSITGTVAPGDSTALVYAISGADTVASTYSGTPSGDFALMLLPPGTYSVAILADVSLRDSTITGVSVTAGQATNLGTIDLSP